MSPRKNQVDLASAIGNELAPERDDRGQPEQGTPTQAPAGPDQPEGWSGAAGVTSESPAAPEPVNGPAKPATRTPTAEDIVAPRRQQVSRRALNVDVPDDLELHRRGHVYRLEQGLDMRDQVALAYDAWLRERNY